MSKKIIPLLPVFVFLLLSACGEKPSQVRRYLEDGVEVIENPLDPVKLKGKPAVLRLEVKYIIDLEEEKWIETGLTDIGDLAVDSENFLYLGNEKGHENLIFKFDPSREFLFSFGHKGEGPGELEFFGYGYTFIGPKNHFFIHDVSSQKLCEFNREGELVSEERIDSFIGQISFISGDRLVLRKLVVDKEAENIAFHHFLICGRDFSPLKNLASIERQDIRSGGSLKFSSNTFDWGISADWIYLGVPWGEYAVKVFDFEGNLIKIIRRTTPPVSLTKAFKKLKADITSGLQKGIIWPEHMPAMISHFCDDEGYLFVYTHEPGENPGETMLDVFDPEGIYAARVSLNIFRQYYLVYAEARNGILYIVQEKDSGYKQLIAYRMIWD